MKKILVIFLLIFSVDLYSASVQIVDSNNNKLNGFHYTNLKSKSIALILHGTRGHQKLELVTSLGLSLLENNIDSLSINLSYGINNRQNDFFPCDIEHTHLESDSIDEIKGWFDYIKSLGYKKIYLIGHSRGGLNMIQFYKNLLISDDMLIHSIFLIAPISDTFKDTRKIYKKKYNIDISKLHHQKNQMLKINFLNCDNAKVSSQTFLNYYDLKRHHGLIKNLKSADKEVYIITASEDSFVPNTYKRVKEIVKDKKNIKLIMIDDADHFFRDLYFDDLMDVLLEATTE
jgi:hypothetical protein